MSKNFWTNKHVLITGARGFIGLHLSRYLTSLGAVVVGVSRHGDKKINTLSCDATNRHDLNKIFAKIPFFACYHLASNALVEQGKMSPYETTKNNILSALNILELCRHYKTRRLIIASTVHVYGNSSTPYLEEYPPRPSRPYETSKTCVDIMAQSYADTYNLPVLIPRFVNIYGPGDLHFDRIIPKTIKEIYTKKILTRWGGTAVREYLYIDDAIRAYDSLAKIEDHQIEKNRIFNFGTGKAISVSELIDTIMTITRSNLKIKQIPDAREHEVDEQRVDWTKAKRILKWWPHVALVNGLKLTIDWYKDYFRIK